MKHLLAFLTSLILLGNATIQAQSNMVVTKTDGTQITIRVDEIADVTFPDDNSSLVNVKYSNYWLHPGQWMQLYAICSDASGNVISTPITWSSSDESVATIDKDGRVTAVADGSCRLWASTGDSQSAMNLQVTSQTMLDITINDADGLYCDYTVTPADPSLRYFFDVRIQSGEYSVDGLNQWGSEEQNLYHFALDWWEFCASLYGMDWLDFMNESGLYQGSQSDRETGLQAGQQYCIFAMAYDENGMLAAPVEVKKFTTPAPLPSDITFEITMDQVTSSSATFTIVPSNDDPYFVNVQRGSYVEWFVERDKLSDMVFSLVDAIKPETYPEAYCEGTVTRSSDDYLSSLRSDEDYYVIVFGYDEGQTSDVTLLKFHTNP